MIVYIVQSVLTKGEWSGKHSKGQKKHLLRSSLWYIILCSTFFGPSFLASDLLNSPIALVCNSAVAGSQPGWEKEEVNTPRTYWKSLKSWVIQLDWSLFRQFFSYYFTLKTLLVFVRPYYGTLLVLIWH